ncbi:MAG: outer membrane beta-barrel protein [Bacteroidales bacterium]|nr:outer membrane beta-barrel protein [Bacteroidales bacterium]
MKKYIIIALLSIVSYGANAQFIEKSDFGIIVGGGNYIGDLNPKYNFYKTKLMVGGIYRYNFNPRWAIRGNFLFGTVAAYDADFENIRNLSFESKINEISAICEFNFFDYQIGSRKHRLTPYIFAGVGVFFMNPKALMENRVTNIIEWVELQPLATEGQGIEGFDSPYSLTQISIPFGLGLKFSVNKFISIGFEWGLRKTFTDYIDDVSKDYVDRYTLLNWSGEQGYAASDRTNEVLEGVSNPAGSMRGNPATKDWYQFFGLIITAKIPHKTKCYTF